MTPEELKKLAIESTKAEFNRIVNQLKEAAEKGSYSSDFHPLLADAIVTQLKEAGFKVTEKYRGGPGRVVSYHNVSIV